MSRTTPTIDDQAGVARAMTAIGAATRAIAARVHERHGADNDYVRTVTSDYYHDRIELAARTLKRFPRDPRVVLVGVSHVADRAFFERVAAALDGCDRVLHESPPIDDEMRAALAEQAIAAGFAHQAQVLPYDDPRWRLADLTAEQQLEAFGETLDVRLTPEAVRRYCRTRRAASAARVAKPARGPRRPLRLPGRQIERLGRVILERRNRVAFAGIERALAEPSVRTVGVLYGAAHLFEIERLLSERLGYRRAGVRWLTAIGNAAWLDYARGLGGELAA